MKKIITIMLMLSILMVGCNNIDSLKFKNEYEALNGKSNSKGYKYREIDIPKSNPFIYSDAGKIAKKIENKETFYVYFGSKSCPWCRSVIEKSIMVADKYNIDKIYYVDIWDDEGNEILRDKYKLENNNLVKVNDGSEEYFKLLEYFDKLLDEYTIDNNGEKIDTLEKRIYAPTFIFVENGEAVKMTTGISDLQTDSREELSEEILADEEKKFKSLFTDSCDTSC